MNNYSCIFLSQTNYWCIFIIGNNDAGYNLIISRNNKICWFTWWSYFPCSRV